MREHLGIETLANAISMLACDRSGAIWISDRDEDARFYEARCAHPDASVLPAPGYSTELLTCVNTRGIGGVVVTVSPPQRPSVENEFSLSMGDATSLLVFSESCTRVMEEVAGRSWLNAANVATGGFSARADKIAAFYGTLSESGFLGEADRAERERIFENLVSWPSFEIAPDSKDMYNIPEELWVLAQTRSETHQLPKYGEFPGVGLGEGLLLTLAGALQHFRPRGFTPHRPLNAEELLSTLRAGYDITEFERDELYWDLTSWQRMNGYPLLRAWRNAEPFGILLDQRYWEGDLTKLLSYKDRRTIAVFKMDLDDFKAVNDQLGHTEGDEAIRLYSTTIKDSIGTFAEIYRRGGDEVIAFAPSTTAAVAQERAEATRASIEERFQRWGNSKGLTNPPTASIGVVICSSMHSKERVITAIDAAQKRAKTEGKNRVVLEILTDA